MFLDLNGIFISSNLSIQLFIELYFGKLPVPLTIVRFCLLRVGERLPIYYAFLQHRSSRLPVISWWQLLQRGCIAFL